MREEGWPGVIRSAVKSLAGRLRQRRKGHREQRREPTAWEIVDREARRLESRRGGIGG